MKDYSSYKPKIDMVNFSGNWHFQEQLKQEGSNFKVNGNSNKLIDLVEVEYRAIFQRHGQDHKEGIEERLLEFDKRFNILTGDYIEYNDETYMVYSHVDKDNPIFNDAKMIMCNQNLNWKGLSITPIPCLITNSSYGSKGEVNTIIQMSDFDARAVIIVGKNEYTEKIRNGMRFIFNNSKDDVYEITKKTTAYNSNSTNGYFQLTCKYVKWVQEDDFVNNIAFNAFLEDSFNPSIDISLLGEENIKIGTTQTYTIQNATGITFSLDEDTVLENNAEIVSQNGISCIIRMLNEKMCQIECRNSLGVSVINPKTIYGIR